MRHSPVVRIRAWRDLTASMLAVLAGAVAWAQPPENLARRARITANSEYSVDYRAANVADGVIPPAAGRNDPGHAWAVQGATHRAGANLVFVWPAPVRIGEVVYYGRTSFANECWRAVDVLTDPEGKPAARARLKGMHGPQRIPLPEPVETNRLVLRFAGDFGGPNPGAAEVRIYSQPAPDAELGKLVPLPAYRRAPPAPPPPTVPESEALLAAARQGKLGFRQLLLAQRHHITCSHVYTYHCEGQRDGGGLYIHDVDSGRLTRIVDASRGQISSCDLSYDGTKVLFSWRRGAFYQVYSVNTDGTDLRALTDGNGHNYDACWLPDDRIVFLSTRRPQAAYCFFTPVGILYTMNADGAEQTCISANYLNDFTPSVMNDGRIVYGRWEYVDRPAIPIQSLWTINPDGTGLRAFFGNRVLDPASFIEPQAIPGTTRVLCTLTGHNGSCRGAVGIVDPTHGNNAPHGLTNLSPEIPLRGIHISTNGPRGPYQTPFPIDDRHYLVSHDGTILVRDYEGTAQAALIAPRDGLGFYNPRPVRARPRPPSIPSTLPARAGPWATVFLQDVYRGLGPTVARGTVKRLCVVEELPRTLIDSKGVRRPAFDFQRVVVSCGATYVPKKVWGFVDVNEDGSAVFRVPVQRPIYFMALDEKGRAIQRMRSFTHLMPGERQGCVGCHEPRRQTTVARPPSTARLAKPVDITPPEWGRIGFNYAAVVQPVLDRHCLRCHDGPGAPKGVDLSGDRTDYFNVSYETLARGRRVLARRNHGNEVSIENPYTNWIPTYNGQERNIQQIEPRTWGSPKSRLSDLILTGHPATDGKARVALSADETQRILTWIDVNVPYYGTADTAHPEVQGCRRQYPAELDRVLMEVAERRCVSCHARPVGGGRPQIPRQVWTRIDRPELNPFLSAPLARSAGGTERCGRPVFTGTDDPDYQAILKTFDDVRSRLEETPRMDMAGATPAACCHAPAQP